VTRERKHIIIIKEEGEGREHYRSSRREKEERKGEESTRS